MWSLILSVVAFILAVRYFRRVLDEQEVNRGMTYTVLVFSLATLVSFAVSAGMDWLGAKLGGNTAQVADAGIARWSGLAGLHPNPPSAPGK